MYVAPSFEDCPVCGSRIPCEDIDSRGEWCRCNFHCGDCDRYFSKLVTFKTQSEEVESETWEDLPGKPWYEKDQFVSFPWKGLTERGRIWKRHVRLLEFHYHIDCPSVTSGKPPSAEQEFTESELSYRAL